MLSKFYGFVVVNNSGQLVTFNNNGRLNLKITGVYIDPATGLLDLNQLADDNLGFVAGQSMANGAERQCTEIDNSVNLYVNALVQLEVTHDEGTAADGAFDIYYEAGDATGELPSDASGYDDAETNRLTYLGSLTWHAAGADDEMMRSPVFVA